MKSFVATLFLLGCALASASAEKCEFPHPGDGGVLDPAGNYIPKSVFVWSDISNCAKQYADSDGKEILENQWIDATRKFDVAMGAKDMATAFKQLHRADDSFKNVAPHINNDKLKAFFLKVYKDFGEKLDTGDVKEINKYMIDVHDAFKNAVQGL